jgi:hypothetical protein
MTAPATTPSAVPPEDAPLRCRYCEAEIADELRETCSDDPVCSECVTACEDCGSMVERSEMTRTADDRISCPDCRQACDECERTFSENAEMRTTASGRHICQQCQWDSYTYCYSCENLFPHDDTFCSGIDDEYRCGECHDEHTEEEQEGPIGEYHSSKGTFTPLESPASKAAGGLYFGVELEVERASNARDSRGDIAAAIESNVLRLAHTITEGRHIHRQLLAFEKDGSLNDGFEMISAPMGLDDQRRLWAAVCSTSATDQLRSHKTETCGLHIHVTRRALTTTQVAKLVTFTNDPDNAALVIAIARRYDNGFCHVKDKKLATAHRPDDDRYQAVNLWNDRTVEFRIFKGSTSSEAVIAALEFVNALVQFCAPCSAVGFNLKTAPFLDFIASAPMRKDTRILRPYLDRRLAGSVRRPANFIITPRKETARCAS